jgi:phosphoglycolate phosphatase
VVFDLDGTLINSRADLANSTNDTLVSYGAAPLPEAQVTSFVGEGARTLVARALAAAALPESILDEALARFLEIYGARLTELTRPYDGVDNVLAAATAAGAALGVITNKPQAPTDRLLHAFGLAPHFQWVIGGDTEFPRKPDPASLIWMMNDAGFEPARTLFVGDSPVDADTARRAGTHFCLAEYGFGQAREATALQPDEFRAATARDISTAIELVRAQGARPGRIQS